MENKITQELLQTIYTRANQYAITKFGSEPDNIKLQSDGTLEVEYSYYCCGSTDYKNEYISAENLTEDLDEVAKQRQIKLDEEYRINEIRRKEEQEKYNKQQKENRRQQFIKLKVEFES